MSFRSEARAPQQQLCHVLHQHRFIGVLGVLQVETVAELADVDRLQRIEGQWLTLNEVARPRIPAGSVLGKVEGDVGI